METVCGPARSPKSAEHLVEQGRGAWRVAGNRRGSDGVKARQPGLMHTRVLNSTSSQASNDSSKSPTFSKTWAIRDSYIVGRNESFAAGVAGIDCDRHDSRAIATASKGGPFGTQRLRPA
jgi:hypothetical protein